MSWRDTVAGRSVEGRPLMGSFRGARFIVPGGDLEFGRRTELHEYPERDKPYVEDLGRKARQFAIEVFVDGTLADGDYTTARDALIAAIEESGPGTLQHPWFGSMRVSVTESRVSESTRQGGRATFRLTCVEAGELRFPSSGTDTAAAVQAAADKVVAAAEEDFAAVYNVGGQAEFFVGEVEAELGRVLASVEDAIGSVTGGLAALVRLPADLAAALVGSVSRISSLIDEPIRALRLYERLFDAGEDSPSVPTNTASRRQQATNVDAIHQVVRRTAVAEASRAAAEADFSPEATTSTSATNTTSGTGTDSTTATTTGGVSGEAAATQRLSRDDALSIRDDLLAGIDAQMEAEQAVSGEPIADEVYTALAALRAAVAEDLRVRGARLPELRRWQPPATLPALVLAHRVHGDAARADEITHRNRIRHPGFVPGGEELEVLNG